jgi:CPA2 family monovalent cation:H+ antiporter-2
MLDKEDIPYMALDLDPDRVRQAAAAGDSVVFGDAARLQSLMAAGLARASAVVVTYLDVPAAMKVLGQTQSHAPQVPVIVRTKDDLDLQKLQEAGATEVVPETLEGSLMLASHALALVGVPMRRVIRAVQDQRDARYNLLKGYFHGADDDTLEDIDHERLTTVGLPLASPWLGKRVGDLHAALPLVRVVGLRRAGGHSESVSDDSELRMNDTLVLSGTARTLATAESRLATG